MRKEGLTRGWIVTQALECDQRNRGITDESEGIYRKVFKAEGVRRNLPKVASKKELKRIVFCQGDKKELEEITGDGYEYLLMHKEGFPENYPLFYWATEYGVSGGGGMDTMAAAMQALYDQALKAGADAVIHFTTNTYPSNSREGELEGLAYGTFVRKKQKR